MSKSPGKYYINLRPLDVPHHHHPSREGFITQALFLLLHLVLGIHTKIYEVHSSWAILYSWCIFPCLLLQLLARIPDVQTFFRGHVHMKCGTSLFLETFKQPPVIRSRCFPRINKSVQTLSCGISGCLYCNQGSCLLAISVLTAGSGHTYLHP